MDAKLSNASNAKMKTGKSVDDDGDSFIQEKDFLDDRHSINTALLNFKFLTTAHGVHHVFRSRGLLKKIVWAIISLCSTGGLITNCYLELHRYMSYETKTAESIENQMMMTFPAVTICNNNPIKASKVFTNNALNSLLPNSGQGLAAVTTSYTTASSTSSKVTSMRASNGTNTQTNKEPATSQSSGNSGSKGNSNSASQSTKTPTMALPGSHGSPVTADFELKMQVQMLLSSVDVSRRTLLGYSLSDLIVDCHFAGTNCSELEFTQFWNGWYGNCYTFNSGWTSSSALRKSYRTGPEYGLSLVFNVQQDEYIGELTQAAGLQVVVHDQKDMPFPESQAIAVGPGQLTYIGASMSRHTRAGAPYDDCIDPTIKNITRNVFEQLYPVQYSDSACYVTCLQRNLVEKCRCGDCQYPLQGDALGPEGRATACDLTNVTQFTCMDSITFAYETEQLGCDHCLPSCNDTTFQVDASSMMWPSNAYLDSLRRGSESGDPSLLSTVSNTDLRENYGKVIVYMETLEYHWMHDTPAYEASTLFADLGGILGLYIGCSLLSMFEFIDLLIEVTVAAILSISRRLRRSPESDYGQDHGGTPEPCRDRAKESFSTAGQLSLISTYTSYSDVFNESFDGGNRATTADDLIMMSKIDDPKQLCGAFSNVQQQQLHVDDKQEGRQHQQISENIESAGVNRLL